jgi:hypothetical protein
MKRPKNRRSWFEHFFLSYGAGSNLFAGLAKSRFWSWFSWVLLVLAILGWVALFLVIRVSSEP